MDRITAVVTTAGYKGAAVGSRWSQRVTNDRDYLRDRGLKSRWRVLRDDWMYLLVSDGTTATCQVGQRQTIGTLANS